MLYRHVITGDPVILIELTEHTAYFERCDSVRTPFSIPADMFHRNYVRRTSHD